MKKRRFDINMPKGYSKTIHLIMILLSLFGAVMVTSASMSGKDTESLSIIVAKQFGFIIISYIFMVIAARKFDWKWFRNPSRSLNFVILYAYYFNLNCNNFTF